MASIKFGTDGFRGVIADDFTFEAVKKITVAVAQLVYEEYKFEKPLLIGYDPRFMGENFAQYAADILSNLGFRVILSEGVVPTPVIAFAARELNTAGALMFTASHNPPEYQGIKFIPPYAGPASKEITDKIVEYTEREPNVTGVKIKDFSFPVSSPFPVNKKSFKEIYFAHLQKIIDFNKIKTLKTKIIFDALYSSSIGYLDELLDLLNLDFKVFNNHFDPMFGGGMPEPVKKYLKYSDKGAESGAVTLSTDGDADRFGILNEKGDFVPPDEIIGILLKHLVEKRNIKGKLVKTIGSSIMLDILAQRLGVDVITTSVGFKWISQVMRSQDVIIGGEESGGISTGFHIPEKDGILACLLVLEAMAYSQKKLFELQTEIKTLVGKEFFKERLDIKLKSGIKKDLIEEIKSLQSVGDFKVREVLDIDGVKLFFDDGCSSILVRPSGTEPLLRVYFESDSKEKIKKLSKGLCFLSNMSL